MLCFTWWSKEEKCCHFLFSLFHYPSLHWNCYIIFLSLHYICCLLFVSYSTTHVYWREITFFFIEVLLVADDVEVRRNVKAIGVVEEKLKKVSNVRRAQDLVTAFKVWFLASFNASIMSCNQISNCYAMISYVVFYYNACLCVRERESMHERVWEREERRERRVVLSTFFLVFAFVREVPQQ